MAQRTAHYINTHSKNTLILTCILLKKGRYFKALFVGE